MKIVRTDSELQTPKLDAALKAAGHDLVLLPDGIAEDALLEATSDADLILMCYTPITRQVIEMPPSLGASSSMASGLTPSTFLPPSKRVLPW